MKMTEITQKTDKELVALLLETRTKLAEAKVEMRTKQVANVKQINALRKTVARIMSAQRQRELTKEEANG